MIPVLGTLDSLFWGLYKVFHKDPRRFAKSLFSAFDQAKVFQFPKKPAVVYMHNTNILFPTCLNDVEPRQLRETFFYDQLRCISEVLLPKKGDFMVDRKYLFEVGGKGKNFDQIKDLPDSFLAVDDTEIGFGNRIPLWTFGLLY